MEWFSRGPTSRLTLNHIKSLDFKNVKFKVIVGKNFKTKNQIFNYKLKNLKVLEFVSEINKLYKSSDIIICGGGTTLVETLFLGKPAIVISQNIFENFFISSLKEKVKLLRDPIISCKEIRLKKKEENELNKTDFKNYFISIGRLTKQKNFLFLIDCFSDLIKRKKNYKLVIIGEGEYRSEIEKKIHSNNLKLHMLLKCKIILMLIG